MPIAKKNVSSDLSVDLFILFTYYEASFIFSVNQVDNLIAIKLKKAIRSAFPKHYYEYMCFL